MGTWPPPSQLHQAIQSLLSPTYMLLATASCFSLFMHCVFCACCLAMAKAGNKSAARMAIIAMTTSNSIRVKGCGARSGHPSANGLVLSLSGIDSI